MTILLDANVLIALAVPEHVHHDAADSWLAVHREDFATCPITEGSLVRFLIREGRPPTAAIAVLEAIARQGRHEFWPDDVSYREVPLEGVIGHAQVTDAYLVHLARIRGARIATFDRALADLYPDVVELIPPA